MIRTSVPSPPRRRWLPYLLATFVLAVTASCGSDGAADDAATESTSASPTTVPSVSPTTVPSVETTSGPASGSPVVVGFHNMEGGAISLPQFRTAFEAAIDYINENLGGLGGRPVEPIICNTDGSPETSIDCANRFVEEGAVLAVQGADGGADGAVPILKDAGIAEFGLHTSGTVTKADLGHSFFFGAVDPSYVVTMLLAMKDAGASTASLPYYDVPALGNVIDILDEASAAVGVEYEVQRITPGAADWGSVVTAALIGDPDAVGSTGMQDADCTAMISALRAASYEGVVFAGGCHEFVEALGAEAASGVFLVSDQYTPYMDGLTGTAREDMDTYLAGMEAAGLSDDVNSIFSIIGFSTAMDAYRVLGSIEGDITAESVLETFRVATGVRFLGGEYDCVNRPLPTETACSTGVFLLQVAPDGSIVLKGDGPVDVSAYFPAS